MMETGLFTNDYFDGTWDGPEKFIALGLTPWRGVMAWVPDISTLTGESPDAVESRLRALWLEQKEAESTWDFLTEGDRLDQAFSRLNERGFYTAVGWGCCEDCQPGAPRPPADGAVWAECVLHSFSAPMLTSGWLDLNLRSPTHGDGHADLVQYRHAYDLVLQELEAAGFELAMESGPDPLMPIVVRSTDWKHRMPE